MKEKRIKIDQLNRILDKLYETKFTFEISDNATKFEVTTTFKEQLKTLKEKESENIYREFSSSASQIVSEKNKIQFPFEARLYERWKKPLDLLDLFLIISTTIGSDFNEKYRTEAAKNNDFKFDVLTRLHAHACLIGDEVITLLRSGYAAGATSRWRSLHETVVTMMFILDKGNDIAERYLRHEVIESWRGMSEYQKYALLLGEKPFSEEEFKKINKLKDTLIAKYGKQYFGQYGWASDALMGKEANFKVIEEAVGLDHMRPYYKLASHHVHSNPKSVLFNLGLLYKEDQLLLSGPSNAGLADPGYLTAISLYQANVSLLGLRPSPLIIVLASVFQKLVDEIQSEFLTVHKTQKSEEEIERRRIFVPKTR